VTVPVVPAGQVVVQVFPTTLVPLTQLPKASGVVTGTPVGVMAEHTAVVKAESEASDKLLLQHTQGQYARKYAHYTRHDAAWPAAEHAYLDGHHSR
jgi:hypothetical protein